MKAFVPFVIAALVTALILYWWQGPGASEPVPAPETTARKAAAKPAPDPEPPKIATKKKGPPPSASTERFAEKPEGNVIAFRVVKGQAIAYGDVMLGTPEDQEATEGYYDAPTPLLWERPEIPYAIANDVPNPQRIERAIEYLRRNSAISFVPFQGQPDAIIFERGNEHCYSLLGRAGGHQPISLSDGCESQEILHEILHALGFIHEQSRTDRDQHVKIEWNNIDEPYKDQFAIVPDSFMSAVKNSDFDFRSIMLYRPDSFARSEGLLTMLPRGPFHIAPVEAGMSEEDLRRLNRMFPR